MANCGCAYTNTGKKLKGCRRHPGQKHGGYVGRGGHAKERRGKRLKAVAKASRKK